MKPDSNPQNQPQPDGPFGPEFMEKFQGAIKSYAEAIASDQAEEADRAAAALRQAIKHRREGFNRSCDPSPHATAALARAFEMLAEIMKKTGDLQRRQSLIARLHEMKGLGSGWRMGHCRAAATSAWMTNWGFSLRMAWTCPLPN